MRKRAAMAAMAAVGLAALVVLLGGCVFFAKTEPQIPTQLIAAADAHEQLVVVLPGMGDNLKVLAQSGIVEAVQRHMPNADVQLVELSLPYYMEGKAPQRLHDEVIAPARQRGYRRIYLAGASMGGMGVLLYERDHPGEMAGLLLMAPYMGDASLAEEIRAAGGLAKWDPGPVPAQLDRKLANREQWRVVKSWLANPERAKSVWVVCGRSDELHAPAELIATTLPTGHLRLRDGGHKWKVWAPGADEVFDEIARSTKAVEAPVKSTT